MRLYAARRGYSCGSLGFREDRGWTYDGWVHGWMNEPVRMTSRWMDGPCVPAARRRFQTRPSCLGLHRASEACLRTAPSMARKIRKNQTD